MHQRRFALLFLAVFAGFAQPANAQAPSGRSNSSGFSASRFADRYTLGRDGAESHSIADLLAHDSDHRSNRNSSVSTDGRRSGAGVRGAGRGFYNHKPIPTPPIHLHPTQRSLNSPR